MRRLYYQIPPEYEGKEVGWILRHALRLSKTKVKRAKFAPGGLLLDGQAARSNRPVTAGQLLEVSIPEQEDSAIVPTPGPVNLRYEDDWLLVAEKPAGLSVHPGPGHYADTLGNYLTWHYQQQGQPFVLRLVNRLDKGTSGLLVAAKSAAVQEALMQQLHTERFRRQYLAICQGLPPEREGTIDLPLGKRPGALNEYQVRPDGLEARTDYRVLERRGDRCLLSLTLHTGRTHQIRVHLAALGCPLAGDALYGAGGPPGRPALHSCKVELLHPINGRLISVESPLPEDLRIFWAESSEKCNK
ncbi:MAG: RluA family pseudouridine synthase [Clostridiales bacterium]|nr:RluA family pseudouridine synthase [Clostridiales bacterium]